MVRGFAASAATSGVVGGRTNHARGVGVGRPSGPDSDETDEDGMDTDSDDIEEEEEEDMVIDALAAHVTIVFEGLGTFWSPVRTVLAKMTPRGASRQIEDTVWQWLTLVALVVQVSLDNCKFNHRISGGNAAKLV